MTKGLSPEQIEMLERAAQIPVPADAEYPEFPEEELRQFKHIKNKKDE